MIVPEEGPPLAPVQCDRGDREPVRGGVVGGRHLALDLVILRGVPRLRGPVTLRMRVCEAHQGEGAQGQEAGQRGPHADKYGWN